MVASRLALLAPFACAALVLLPGSAQAAFTSCTFTAATNRVAAVLPSDGDGRIGRDAAGAIRADGIACGAATVTSTDTIAVTVTGATASETVQLDLGQGPLAPGATPEGGGSDEIEVTIDLGTGSGDAVEVLGSAGADRVTSGSVSQSTQLNLNAGESGGIDADVTVPRSISQRLYGLGGNDVLRGYGGDGTPVGGFAPTVEAHGGDGADDVSAKQTFPGPGDDTVRFAGSQDEVSYAGAPGPVAVATLDGATGQPGGGTLTGRDGHGTTDTYTGEGDSFVLSRFDDSFTGDAGRENVYGAEGGDLLDGAGGDDLLFGDYVFGLSTATVSGPDRLRGGAGNDVLFADGGDDELDGEAGDDRLLGDDGVDAARGGDGDDVLDERAGGGPGGSNGADLLSGGSGTDRIDYGDYRCAASAGGSGFTDMQFNPRTVGVTADLDGEADDGAPGEGDRIAVDVENLQGTNQADRLTGDGKGNVLTGLGGGDALRGGDGADRLEGVIGACPFGDDTSVALPDGDDDLDGEGGVDVVRADRGDDRVNAVDGVADTIDCGAGTDPALLDAVDTATACEPPPPAPPVDPGPGPGPGSEPGVGPGAGPAPGGGSSLPPAGPALPAGPTVRPGPAVVTPALPSVTSLVDRPATKRCLSRRTLRLRVRKAIVGQVRSVTVLVGGKRRARVTGKRLGLPVDLRGLPKGRFTVRLDVVLADGRTATDTRRYRSCVPRRR